MTRISIKWMISMTLLHFGLIFGNFNAILLCFHFFQLFFTHFIISRLFGIVLCKFLLPGKDIDTELVDWHTCAVTAKLPCDLPAYLQLIQLCFDPTITSPLVASLIS